MAVAFTAQVQMFEAVTIGLEALCGLHRPSVGTALLIFLLTISVAILLSCCCWLAGCVCGITASILVSQPDAPTPTELIGTAVKATRLALPIGRAAAARLRGYKTRQSLTPDAHES